MTEDEAWELKEFIEKETGRLDVGVKRIGNGAYVCHMGNVLIWHMQDWYNYRATMTQQVPVKAKA